MRTAVTFWQMPSDDAALFDFLRSAGAVRVRRHRSEPQLEPIEFLPLSAFRRRGSDFLVLCRECDLAAVKVDRFKSEGRAWHTVSDASSPVLTYSREKPVRGVLHQSTLGASLDYVDLKTGQKRQKDDDFKKWAKSVVAWVRNRCTETCELNGFKYSATPDVARCK
jgi:hypothetical protein